MHQVVDVETSTPDQHVVHAEILFNRCPMVYAILSPETFPPTPYGALLVATSPAYLAYAGYILLRDGLMSWTDPGGLSTIFHFPNSARSRQFSRGPSIHATHVEPILLRHDSDQ